MLPAPTPRAPEVTPAMNPATNMQKMAVPPIHHDRLLYTNDTCEPNDSANHNASSRANTAREMIVPENTLPQRTSCGPCAGVTNRVSCAAAYLFLTWNLLRVEPRPYYLSAQLVCKLRQRIYPARPFDNPMWPPLEVSGHTGSVDLRQLAALVAIADHGSFSGAAAALHTVQSNVSGHIKRLERDLGVVLVDRQTGQLTEEGRAVESRARAVQAEMDAIATDLAALHQQVIGNVRLGMISTTARWLVPLLLDRLAIEHPGVRLVTTEASSSPLGALLTNGGLDCAVVNLPLNNPELKLRPLFDEDIVLLAPADHPLASTDGLHIRDLEGVELILPAPHTGFREELDHAARAAGITLHSKAEVDGLRLLGFLALRGYGPALLPATTVATVPDDYKILSLTGVPLRHVGIAMRKRGRPSAPTRALIDVLEHVTSAHVAAHGHLHSATI